MHRSNAPPILNFFAYLQLLFFADLDIDLAVLYFAGHSRIDTTAVLSNHTFGRGLLCTCLAIPTKKNIFLPNLRSNRQLEPPLPLIFSYRIFSHSAQAPKFPLIHRLARRIWAPRCTPVSVAKRQQLVCSQVYFFATLERAGARTVVLE